MQWKRRNGEGKREKASILIVREKTEKGKERSSVGKIIVLKAWEEEKTGQE